MDSNNAIVLIVLSTIVLISHFFNVISKFLRIPSVLFLIGLGIVLKQISYYFNFQIFELGKIVTFLGAIGLILIVLEGVLELKVRRESLVVIRKSFGAALIILLASSGLIAALFHSWLKADLWSAFINAIPLAVISSAIVIPSIHHLTKDKRDFLTYESIFSDIVGIMLFNFILTQGALSLTGFFLQTCMIIIISLIVSLFLIQFIFRMKTKTKFFIILSLLVLVYEIGKYFHFSSLLLIFVFGLLLSNYNYFTRLLKFGRMEGKGTEDEIANFKQIVDESAFLIRTFFFIAFGYSIDLMHMVNWEIITLGVPIVLILLLIRYIYLKYIVQTYVFPELFIAPKGLITILLFYSIPKEMLIPSISEGVILFVILATSLLMLAAGGRQEAEI